MITEISGFGMFFVQKMAVSWRISVFQKMPCWNPYFYSVFWVRAFWPSCQKGENLDTHQKQKKKLTDNWKVFFFGGGYFCVFCFLVICFVFVFLFCCQVRWPEGPPHLALKPPYFLFLFIFVCFCFVFSATSLGPKPSLFIMIILFCFVLLFPFFAF